MTQKNNKRPYLIIATIMLLISTLLIAWPPLFIQFLENKTFDFRFLLRSERPIGNEIVIVGIDEESLKKVGRWPWPRDKIAELIDKIAKGGAKTIGVDILFSEPEKDSGNVTAKEILHTYQQKASRDKRFLAFLQQKARETSGDAKLAKTIADAGNVILPFVIQVPVSRESHEVSAIPEDIFFYPFMVVKEMPFNRPIVGSAVLLPITPLMDSAWSLGNAYTQYDIDGAIRWEPLSVRLGKYYFPSLGIEVTRHYLGLNREDVQLVAGEAIVMGNQVIDTDASGRVLINYAGKEGTFPMISAVQVLEGNVPRSVFQDKIALIGTTALGTSDSHVTPFSQLSGIEKQASVIECIIHQNFLTKEELIKLLNFGFIFIFYLVSVIYLPRLNALGGAALTTVFICFYLLVTQYLFLSHRLWVDLMVPAGSMFILYTIITAYRFLTEEVRARKIRTMFSSYTSEKVVNELLAHPERAKLGGVNREVTVLFSDVRGFTSFS